MPEEELENQEEVVEQAKERGWVPKEEWTGKEEEWVPANEFMERAKLYDAISSANNKIKNLEKANEQLTKHYEGIKKGLKEQHERELAALKEELATAAEEGDKQRVTELNDEIVKQSNKIEEDSKTNSNEELDQYNKDWVENNPWYEVDEEKTNYAKLIATGILNQYADPETGDLTISVPEVYRKIDKEMEARFGEESNDDDEDPDSKGNGKTHTAVSKKTKRGSGVKKNKENLLTPEQKKMRDNLVRQGVMTSEQYIKDLEEAGYLGES